MFLCGALFLAGFSQAVGIQLLKMLKKKEMEITEKLDLLRHAMREQGLDAYLVPSSDPHQSEYVAAHWTTREWLSGFTGSAGLLLVTAKDAGLWTDSRYFLQAETELAGSGIVLQRQQTPHAPEHIQWLIDNLPAGSTVGIDGALFSVTQVRHLNNRLAKADIRLNDHADLIYALWRDRPALPDEPIFAFPDVYAGLSRPEKLGLVRQELEERDVEWHFLSTLDDIAWVLNLRGSDVPYNPVFIAYLAIGENEAILFVDPQKVKDDLKQALQADGVSIRPYPAAEVFLKEMSELDTVWVDPTSLNMRLYSRIAEDQLEKGENRVRQLKAIKSETEIGHIREAMRKDGVALTKLYRWLESVLPNRAVTEAAVARQLSHFRRAGGDYYGESFGAIVGYRANGAIVHYRPDPDTSAELRQEGLLLIDSGGQYLQGTTDITRTITLGAPTEEERRNFTLVLKGHIALATARFPSGTTGVQLDAMARRPLWQHGLNYGHGTGHGVGFFLNVHEPPQGFAAGAATSRAVTALAPGMLTSNEPGFYKTGEYGIRTENLVLCVPGEENEYGEFLQFETLTLFPIDLRLVAPELLDAEEKTWLNDYHRQVFDELKPLLNPEEQAWLQEKCGTVE